MTREEWRNIYAECQPFLEFTVENPQAAQWRCLLLAPDPWQGTLRAKIFSK
jgi:hypothetical protein